MSFNSTTFTTYALLDMSKKTASAAFWSSKNEGYFSILGYLFNTLANFSNLRKKIKSYLDQIFKKFKCTR